MEKRGKYEQREKKLAAKICARKSVQGFVLSGGEGELGVDGGSNGQKNITFDLSIGGERSRRAELIQVDVYVVDKHSGKCGEVI